MKDTNNFQSQLDKAKHQIRNGYYPMIGAVLIALFLATRTGLTLIVLGLLGGGAWAWWRGYRIKVKRPGRKEK